MARRAVPVRLPPSPGRQRAGAGAAGERVRPKDQQGVMKISLPGCDGQAIGVYHAVHQLGLRVPDGPSVIGFDDMPSARWAIPPLTTIRLPLAEMAASATSMVLKLADVERLPQNRVELAAELVVRESTAPAQYSSDTSRSWIGSALVTAVPSHGLVASAPV
ncbi:hypothetical protein E1292_00595 [Nonomuraea deserti]|uniref:Transcriptional regulator LacI/GalR-like sensor domain-containing protein n=1 Tax=Nonomuraea deserti TaxID=1848322 RepID=A0A4R4W796_9ACTN|nr:substrate-binding domain-containing protein [Nonomuraea deserti]TDD12867.1 hypothetical protein E1292_00595 [Nonomuraea deserti]